MDFGCLYCKNRGEHDCRKLVYLQSRGTTVKTQTDYIMSKNTASPDNPIFGIKGPTAFEKLTCIDHYSSFPIDYMHSSILGVGKLLLSLYFSEKYKSKPFSVNEKLAEISQRCERIEFPAFVPRDCKDLKNFEKWKANQIRAFFLYAALPLLKNPLKPEFFAHLKSFVFILHTSLSSRLSHFDLEGLANASKFF